MDAPLDHVALVVRRLEPVIERLGDLEAGAIEAVKVEQVELPGHLPVHPRPGLVASGDADVWLTITGTRYSVSELTGETR